MVVNNDKTIAVLLNVFKRAEYLDIQLKALEEQTVKPISIYVWQNEGDIIPEHLKQKFILAECSINLGVWARFSFALNINADYICILDDDTIPGNRWLENCLNTVKKYNGLLGTRGIRFRSKKKYSPFDHYGWGNPNKANIESPT